MAREWGLGGKSSGWEEPFAGGRDKGDLGMTEQKNTAVCFWVTREDDEG